MQINNSVTCLTYDSHFSPIVLLHVYQLFLKSHFLMIQRKFVSLCWWMHAFRCYSQHNYGIHVIE